MDKSTIYQEIKLTLRSYIHNITTDLQNTSLTTIRKVMQAPKLNTGCENSSRKKFTATLLLSFL